MKSPAIALLAASFALLVLPSLLSAETKVEPAKEEKLPIEELRAFAEIFDRIKNDYVEKVGDKKLIEHAIRGMVEGLDPHSSYLNKEEYNELQVGTSGEFGGLGIEVGMEDGFVKVITPIDDTPAQRAGLQPGDLIMRLDDQAVKGMSLDDAVKKMRGKPGTSILLTVLRKGKEKPLEFTLERAVIKVKSVKARMLEPGYGYVRLTTFQANTAEEMVKAIQQLMKESKDKLNGMVLDLRNNPGGVLNSAVGVSDAFLEDGQIVYTQGRLPDSQLSFSAGPDDVLKGAPLVVLVNDGSASASEIVAGALQDRKRAVIMGGQTFGKGSVQTVIPVGDHGALKLTTARYYTPSGRSIQAQGIAPDIAIQEVKVTAGENNGNHRVKEADLTGHLEQKQQGQEAQKKETGKEKGTKEGKDAESKSPLAVQDYALNEAVNLLKGLNILRQPPAVAPTAEADKTDKK